MKILVCIKQVPDMESKFKIDGTWYDNSDLAWRMNEYDEYAVEQAVQVKEQIADAELTVLCVGPERVKETMKKALAMGCDRGDHILDDQAALRDPYEISSIIASYAKDKSFDLIFCGMQSQDRASAQVGILVGELLGIPSISTIVDFQYDNGSITVKRELEGGIKSRISTKVPALLTCQLGLNTPRYPTLPNIMKAKKKELLSIPVEEFLQVESGQETTEMFFPEKKGGGVVLEGDPAEIAESLIKIIREKTTVMG